MIADASATCVSGAGASLNSGTNPLWTPNGSELFYSHGTDIMSVSVKSTATFTAGRPLKLFGGPFDFSGTGGNRFDITPDGKRFVIVAGQCVERPMQINVVLNGLDEIRRLTSDK
jgi:hypothetical protein